MNSPQDQPPLTPRPAATVMLIREGPESPGGISVFLMRRHSAM
ncbi:MAG: NUDIX hydrolase, partial [Mycobacterium sp.]